MHEINWLTMKESMESFGTPITIITSFLDFKDIPEWTGLINMSEYMQIQTCFHFLTLQTL